MKKMKPTGVLKIINVLLALDFLLIATTAIFHNLIAPTGFYRPFHALPGFIFLGLVIIHLFLNRKWIKANYFKKKES
ncbi:MAG: DUF4405 domain-containing protein [Spirochaetales bacterium]|nr:DUF4405 domain-containing protein [Spirochaetales bacterium]